MYQSCFLGDDGIHNSIMVATLVIHLGVVIFSSFRINCCGVRFSYKNRQLVMDCGTS